jgi:hypothetical protein
MSRRGPRSWPNGSPRPGRETARRRSRAAWRVPRPRFRRVCVCGDRQFRTAGGRGGGGACPRSTRPGCSGGTRGTAPPCPRPSGRGCRWSRAAGSRAKCGPASRAPVGGVIGQAAREGQVKAELLHHVRIAPAQQQRLLPGGQARLAAAGQLGLEGGARKASSARRSQRPDRQGASGSDGTMAMNPPRRRTSSLGIVTGGRVAQKLSAARCRPVRIRALGQEKRRLDRAVKAVFARRAVSTSACVGQARDLGMRHRPARPRCPSRASPRPRRGSRPSGTTYIP